MAAAAAQMQAASAGWTGAGKGLVCTVLIYMMML